MRASTTRHRMCCGVRPVLHSRGSRTLPSMLSSAMSMSSDSFPRSLSRTQPPAHRSTVPVPACATAARSVSKSSFSSGFSTTVSRTVCPAAADEAGASAMVAWVATARAATAGWGRGNALDFRPEAGRGQKR